MKVDLRVVSLRRKGKPRGSPKGLVPFKPGHDPRRYTGGGAPQMGPLLARKMNELAPPQLLQIFGLHHSRKVTKGELVLEAVLHRAITTGDPATVLLIHDLTEGKLPTKNVSVSVELETYMNDPQFRAYVQEQHRKYLTEGGQIIDAG